MQLAPPELQSISATCSFKTGGNSTLTAQISTEARWHLLPLPHPLLHPSPSAINTKRVVRKGNQEEVQTVDPSFKICWSLNWSKAPLHFMKAEKSLPFISECHKAATQPTFSAAMHHPSSRAHTKIRRFGSQC
jgi:hypothetical protein